MRPFLLPAAILLWACSARADVFVVEGEDGVHTITNQRRPKGGKILYREKERAPRSSLGAPSAGGGQRASRSEGPISAAAPFAGFVRGAATHYALPEALIWAVMKIESGFNPNAVSDAGAQGLMQLMPGTAGDMGVKDPFDPEQNIYGGARYLRLLANRFKGDLVLTLSGYHAGGGAVNAVGGIPFDKTSEYVGMVLKAYYRFQRELPVAPAAPVVDAP